MCAKKRKKKERKSRKFTEINNNKIDLQIQIDPNDYGFLDATRHRSFGSPKS